MTNYRFQTFIDGHKPARPLLPGLHITNVDRFGKIIDSNRIKLTTCTVYKKELSYLFYGKPAYKIVRAGAAPSKILADAAVCLVLNLAELPPVKRAFAFDTGAYFGNRYDNYMPTGVAIDDFELNADRLSPARLVAAFFGCNKNYYDGDLREGFICDPLDSVSEAYSNMVGSKYANDFDERAATCELQFDEPIKLNKKNVLSAIIPNKLLGSSDVQAAMRRWGVDPILYSFKRAIPSERTEVIFEKLNDFYQSRSYV